MFAFDGPVESSRTAVAALWHVPRGIDRLRQGSPEEVAAALATQSDYVQPNVTGLAAIRLAPDVQLLTYQDDAVMHSSIWTRADSAEWRLRFHQQTRRQ